MRRSSRHLPRAIWPASASSSWPCTSTRPKVGLGASPERPIFAGDKSSLHWYCDLPLHCSVLCHDTRWTFLPVVMLCFCFEARDKACSAFRFQLSPRSVFFTRPFRLRRLESLSQALQASPTRWQLRRKPDNESGSHYGTDVPALDKHPASNLTKMLSANP